MRDKPFRYVEANDDALVQWGKAFTSRIGDGTGDPEDDYFSCTKLIAACKTGQKFLDVGSGHGRLIKLIKPYAGHIVGLEPDAERFQICRRHLSAYKNVELHESTLGQYRTRNPQSRFDVVILSMVIQHVSSQLCNEMLCDVREHLAPAGVALVATTNFFEERFTYQRDASPRTPAEFDEYADSNDHDSFGVPVRLFSKESFLGAIDLAGLEVIVWHQFYYVRPEHASGVAMLFGVSPELIRDMGLSQYALVKSKGTP